MTDIKKKRLVTKIEVLLICLAVVFIVCQVILDLAIPGFMSNITKLIKQTDTQVPQILSEGGLMILCAIGSGLCSIIVGFAMARLSAGVTRNIRNNIFVKVSELGVSEVQKFSTASLITRTTNDVRQVAMFIAFGLQVIIKAPIMATLAIVKIVGKSWELSLATMVSVGLMLVVFLMVVLFVIPKFKKIQTQTDELNNVARENLLGIRVVHAFNAEDFEQNKFEKTNSNLTKTNLFVGRLMSAVNPFMSFVMNGLSLAIFVIGAFLINSAGDLEKIGVFGDIVVFSSYAIQVVISFMLLAVILFILPRAIVSMRRINEVLKTKSTIVSGDGDFETSAVGEIEFNGVSFSYPGAKEKVLEDISFKANSGQTIAIIGSTASGKSTLVNLLARFYDPTNGEILVDNVNISNYKLEDLYNKIGYISQTSTILSGTIYDNVSLGNGSNGKPSREDVLEAIKISQAEDFVLAREKNIDDDINQGGTNLSGGQKQRLNIARAIAKKPEILIFDDSFSALDYKTDKLLRKALKKELSGTTIVIVAQRIGTIKDADLILVLDNGKIVGKGSHKELLNSCNVYKEIALSQLSEEELKDGSR